MTESLILHKFTVDKRRTSEELLREEGPYTSLLSEVVDHAKKVGASDIHIEPTMDGIDIRIRINGDLELVRQAGKQHRESLIFEAKRLFGLAIGTSGKPQDGRVSLPSIALDMRVSLIPTFYGEKLVMRLLNMDTNFEVETLGFSDLDACTLKESVRFNDGLVVISGPTGSGKTRTLYSLLRSLDHRHLNIVTIEDPVEYRLNGINQVQVSERVSFSDALRSMLRQDPDVILVGEVRDQETARLCFQAAATGHLVFTTVHANSASQVLDRFRNLGIADIDLKSCLRLSIAQRLTQILCPDCSTISDGRKRKRNPSGCLNCHAGIIRRQPIIEHAKATENFEVVKTLEITRREMIENGQIDESEEM